MTDSPINSIVEMDSPGNDGLPEGWALPLVGDFLELKYGKGLTKSGRVSGEVPVYGSNGQVGSHNKAVTDGQTIVVGRCINDQAWG